VEVSSGGVNTVCLAATAAGIVANPICLWSEWTLKTTGAGLPPGPGGLLGAAGGWAAGAGAAGARRRSANARLAHCLPADPRRPNLQRASATWPCWP
jgi:hypothetical protein